MTAGGTTVRGLVINRFSGNGIELNGSSGNTIQGNYLGTDLSGSANRGNSLDGLYIDELCEQHGRWFDGGVTQCDFRQQHPRGPHLR